MQHVFERRLGLRVKLTIKHIQDYRNYKVSFEKALNVLSIKPRNDVESIIDELIRHEASFSDFDNPVYYNIRVFQSLKPKAFTL